MAIGFLRWPNFPDWRHVIVVICVLIAGQILEGYVIYPRFLGDRVELPAVWVIFARVRRRGGVRICWRDARGADRGNDRRAGSVLAAALPLEPALS